MDTIYQVKRSTTASKVATIFTLFLLVFLISAPFWVGRANARLIIEIAYYLALAQMWNLLAGYTGLISVGQQAFVGLGGYVFFVLAIDFKLPPLLAVLLAGIIVGICALPTALIVFRLKGAYFAIGTWVVAEVYRLGFAQVTSLGGGSGKSIPAKIVKAIASSRRDREMFIYFLALVICLAIIVWIYLLLRSKYGLALTAIRDSEPASDSTGINIFKMKLLIYIQVGLGTGLIGALIFLQKLRISPDAAFSLQDWTVAIIFIVVIGGIGTIEGPIIGTFIYFGLRFLLADYGSLYLIVLGAVAVGIMLKMPQGVWGLISSKLNLHFFPVHRHLVIEKSEEMNN